MSHVLILLQIAIAVAVIMAKLDQILTELRRMNSERGEK